jgi:sugar lactone lactonase YvrE
MAAHVTAVYPQRAIETGRITIEGSGFPVTGPALPEIRIGDLVARTVFASSTRMVALVPPGLGGRVPVRIGGAAGQTAFVDVAAPLGTGLHQVDSPVVDAEGNVYVTYSGTRGQQVPVAIFRVRPNGTRETFASGIVNPTSMAIDPDGQVYVSSRFEGVVYRLTREGSAEPFATDLGVACGMAFAPDGTLYVGDRTGTVFRVGRDGRAAAFASLPGSVAAFHVALSPDRTLYVTGPTLSPYDVVYAIDRDGNVTRRPERFGRPQGLAFDPHGRLHVVEAMAGSSGVYRLRDDGEPELVVAGPGLIGLAFDRAGGLIVCSSDTAYRLAA